MVGRRLRTMVGIPPGYMYPPTLGICLPAPPGRCTCLPASLYTVVPVLYTAVNGV